MSSPRILVVSAAALLLWGCAAAERTGSPRAQRKAALPDASTATPSSSGAASTRSRPTAGRFPLAEVEEAPLPVELLPIPGGQSVLFVSQHAGERPAWVRRLDGRSGTLGVPIPVAGRHVLGAFDGRTEGAPTTLVTSEGSSLCVATYTSGSALPTAKACASVAPHAVARAGDRLALLEVAPLSRAPGRADPGTSASKRPRDLRLRWATATSIEAQSRSTGLHFDEPLAGFGLVDARSRAHDAGLDLLWYEATEPSSGSRARAPKARAPLGWARLSAGSLDASGTFIPDSRVTLFEGEVDYGGIRDHRGVRLGGLDGALAIGLDANGQCEAFRVAGSSPATKLAPTSALCALDPDRLASAPPDSGALGRLLAERPRRAIGQSDRDPGLVAWAGSRGYFLSGTQLRSAARADGVARDEPAPLAGRRARLHWASFAEDGEGVALAGAHLVHVDAEGRIARTDILPLAPSAGANRRRAARIGASWWIADGDVSRLLPTVLSPPDLRGRAPRDGAVLVGGSVRGLLLELGGGTLRVSALDALGAESPLGVAAISPVRAGFDACERHAGGAIVAGVSAADPARVLAFSVDRDGGLGEPVPAPLPIEAGHLGVRLVPRPGGGAWLTARDGADAGHVLWLDDEGRPVGRAPVPATPPAQDGSACLDGRRSPLLPSPVPGVFVPVAALSAPDACVVGDPVWTSATGATGEREVRWFGSAARGLDAIPELGIDVARLAGGEAGAPAPPEHPRAPGPAPHARQPPACPGDMVSVGGRYCIDRFESTLVEARTGEALSPDYPLGAAHLELALGEWATGRRRAGDAHARAFPLPFLARSRRSERPEPLARSELGARPNGYVSGLFAEAACRAAGKRLCTRDEHRTACRGEDDTPFPYGQTYVDGLCNVFRAEHPAAVLHGNASVGHLDPRLNRVESRGGPLLRPTGGTLACRSRWGSDAAYDLVGNLDEWVSDPRFGGAAFAGGFYARATRAGCGAIVSAHPKSYADYSTGVRCCRDAGAEPPSSAR